ncbi:hypothetical protein PspLS_00797 [Pyricularia sp. CBS 133598]|nr:hypothetical protein PspLS_00797 [Pyricularia sp. CBS 133598]
MRVWQGSRGPEPFLQGRKAVDRVAGASLRSLQACWPLRPDELRPGFSNSPGMVSPVCATEKKQIERDTKPGRASSAQPFSWVKFWRCNQIRFVVSFDNQETKMICNTQAPVLSTIA